MVLWSGSFSDKWINEGKKVTAALPDTRFVYHYGGRWPQVDAYEEISNVIAEFVTSLPKSVENENEEHRSHSIDHSFDEATDGQSDRLAA